MGPDTAIVRTDEKGRVVIPRKIRKRTELREGSYVKITTKEKSIVIEPIEPTNTSEPTKLAS